MDTSLETNENLAHLAPILQRNLRPVPRVELDQQIPSTDRRRRGKRFQREHTQDYEPLRSKGFRRPQSPQTADN